MIMKVKMMVVMAIMIRYEETYQVDHRNSEDPRKTARNHGTRRQCVEEFVSKMSDPSAKVIKVPKATYFADWMNSEGTAEEVKYCRFCLTLGGNVWNNLSRLFQR